MVNYGGSTLGPSVLPGGALAAPITFEEDFLVGYTAPAGTASGEADPTGMFSPVPDRGDWLYSFDEGGSDPTIQDNADGGLVKFHCDGDTGDRSQIQLNGESFLLQPGRRFTWQARLKWDVFTGDSFIGMSTSTANVLGTKPTDGIFGFQFTGTSALEYYADVTGGSAPVASSASFTLPADTFVTLAFHYDGVRKIHMIANATPLLLTTTNIPINQYMSPIFAVQSNGAEQGMTIDYVIVQNDRSN